jgi:pentatricopeptide repeat domain-containing protein 1
MKSVLKTQGKRHIPYSNAPLPDLKSYNNRISYFSRIKKYDQALKLVEDMKSRHMKPDATTLTILINMHVKTNNFLAAENLFNEWRMQSDPDRVLYTTAISLFLKSSQTAKAMATIEEMKARGILPDAILYNSMLACYTKMSFEGVPRVLELLEEMKAKNIKADERTYVSMILTFTVLKRFDMVETIFSDLVERGFLPNLHIYTIMISSYFSMNRPDMALALFREMKENGCPPSIMTYTKLIHGFEKEGNEVEMVNLMSEMMERGIGINLQAFHLLLKFFAERRNDREVMNLYHNMSKFSLTPDRFTYGVLIRLFRDMGQPEEAMNFAQLLKDDKRWKFAPAPRPIPGSLNEMCNDRDLVDGLISTDFPPPPPTSSLPEFPEQPSQPDFAASSELVKPATISHASMLHMLARRGMVEDTAALFAEMPTSEKHVGLYNVMMKMYIEAKRFTEALMIYEIMKANALKPDGYTYSALVETYYLLKQQKEVLDILQEMESLKLVPTMTTYLYGIKILSLYYTKSAYYYFEQMASIYAAELTLKNFNLIISGFVERRFEMYALNVYNKMVSLNIKPDLITYVMLITSLCRRKNSTKVQWLLSKMEEAKIAPDEHIYTSIISMYSRLKMLPEAVSTFNELIKKGIVPKIHTYCALLGMAIC